MLDLTTLIGGGALAGVIIGGWSTIQDYISKLYGVFVVRAQVIDPQTVAAIANLLWSEFERSDLSKRLYRGNTEYVQPLRRNALVGFEMLPPEMTAFWRGRRPLFVKADEWGSCNHVDISTIRGLYNLDALIIEALQKFNCKCAGQNHRFFISHQVGSIGQNMLKGLMAAAMRSDKDSGSKQPFNEQLEEASKFNSRPLQWEFHQLGIGVNAEPFGALALSKEVHKAVEDVGWWLDSRDWMQQRSVPWKLGMLFYGKPGTGKTATVRAIAQHYDMPLFVFDLSTMNNRDFVEKWGRMMEYAPCLALFEDIDSVFKGRMNIVQAGEEAVLSFDCFINCIDGVDTSEGILTIITTNHIEYVDEALARAPAQSSSIPTRPGRIDRVVEFGCLERIGRWRIANRLLPMDYKDMWQHVIDDGKDDTGAQFQNRCMAKRQELLAYIHDLSDANSNENTAEQPQKARVLPWTAYQREL